MLKCFFSSLLDGTAVELVATGLSYARQIALDVTGAKIYLTSHNCYSVPAVSKISRLNLDGSGFQDIISSPGETDCPEEIALDLPAGKMYWADYAAGSIRRANLDGSAVEQFVHAGANQYPIGIALDGSLGAGACPTETPTSTPTSMAIDTPTPTPTPVFPCPPGPLAGCRTPGKSKIILRDSAIDSRDALLWKWLHGAATDGVDFSNPLTGSTSYALCVYDQSGTVDSLAMSMIVPPGGTCIGRPCWRETTRGFRYRDANEAAGGVRTMRLNAGGDGRASIVVKGHGVSLPMPAPLSESQYLHQDTKVTVQLIKSDGGPCWEAVYPAPAGRNTNTQFKDRLP